MWKIKSLESVHVLFSFFRSNSAILTRHITVSEGKSLWWLSLMEYRCISFKDPAGAPSSDWTWKNNRGFPIAFTQSLVWRIFTVYAFSVVHVLFSFFSSGYHDMFTPAGISRKKCASFVYSNEKEHLQATLQILYYIILGSTFTDRA